MSFVLLSKVSFAERVPEKAHIVEVGFRIVDDVKAVGTRLVPCKAHSQSVAHVDEVPAARHSGKAAAAYLLKKLSLLSYPLF